MTNDFNADSFKSAMQNSMNAMRSGDLTGATHAIQAALNGQAQPPAGIPDKGGDDGIEDAQIIDVTPPRRRLRDVVSGLANRPAGLDMSQFQTLPGMGNLPGMAGVRQPLAIPDGAQFLSGRFDHAQGGRDYRLYVPATRPIAGAVVMLHGCTQTADDFAAGTAMCAQAESQGFVVIFPEQGRSNNAQGCWNWFNTADQGANAGEPAILAAMTRALCADHDVPQGCIFVAGLSAGGAMAAILGATHPELFAGVGVHSGLAPGSARDMIGAFAAMRGDQTRPVDLPVPAIIFQGMADHTVAPVNAQALSGSRKLSDHRTVGDGTRKARVSTGPNAKGAATELWQIDGMGHAWSGGSAAGSYTDPAGPDASAEMLRFFRAQCPANR